MVIFFAPAGVVKRHRRHDIQYTSYGESTSRSIKFLLTHTLGNWTWTALLSANKL